MALIQGNSVLIIALPRQAPQGLGITEKSSALVEIIFPRGQAWSNKNLRWISRGIAQVLFGCFGLCFAA
jgi:hypothetical protein